MRQPNVPIMVNVSLGADAASNPIFMEQEAMVSIQAIWSGSPVGNFTIETTDDAGQVNPATGLPVPASVADWNTYTGSTVAAGGSTGIFTWRIWQNPDRWIRLKYTSTSGTGTINARSNAKGA